ncbi:MAG TPA: insulinase family protein [Pseudomonadales bacterium]
MTHLRALLVVWLTLLLASCVAAPPAPVETPSGGAEAGEPGPASGESPIPVESVEADEPAPPKPSPAPAPAAEPKPPATEVQKSPNDDREYRYLTLENGLRVLLVHDRDTDRAAASLVVFRGSYHEPADYPGLAHFLEHMLFIGTEKYPQVDAYQEFVSQHGGSSNAYTAGDHTNYFFDIRPEQFREAMDRFAQFFVSPLFEAGYVDREKNAVHSEYQLQLKADNWRGAAVLGKVMNPAHPESRFSIGSLETLDAGVGDALIEFFRNNYSADQMVLVALSNEPLDAMESWIRPMFRQIENRHLGPAPVGEPLFLEYDLPAVVRYQTIKQGYRVAYNFPVPSVERYYREKPATYITNLLGHEGQGSLYQRLQQEGWIVSLSAGTGSFDEQNSVLAVEIELTDSGYENLPRVTEALFDYIALLRDSAPEAWRYRELARMAELGFRFQEESSASAFVYQVAPRFMDYPPEDVLVAPYLMTDFDPELIRTYLDALTMDNVVMEIAGPDVPTDARERWFDVGYQVEHGPPPRTQEETTGLKLPPPNPYLPENLQVHEDEPEPPRLVVARPGLTLWSDRDTEFESPRKNLYLSLGVPDGIASASDLAMATLYVRLVQDVLSEAVYPAHLAGLGYGLDVDGFGFQLAISGYSDKQLTLLGTVLEALTSAPIDPERFETLKAELIRDWGNFRDERPYTQAYSALSYLLLSNRWPPEMLIAELEPRTAADLETWRERRAAKFHVVGLDHGNVAVEGAWALASTLQEHLTLGAFPRRAPQVVELSEARRYQLDVDHQDAAMVLYLQDPDSEIKSRAVSGLAAAILRQPYFTSLRTEQQLGYVVAVAHQTLRDRAGLAFIVQSPVASAARLEQATRTFLTEQIDAVSAMTDATFENYKRGLISTLLKKDDNLAQRGRRLWANLDLGVTTFDLDRQLADEVAKLTREHIVEYLRSAVERFDEDRLLVFSNGQFDDVPSGGEALGSVREFKRTAAPVSAALTSGS